MSEEPKTPPHDEPPPVSSESETTQVTPQPQESWVPSEPEPATQVAPATDATAQTEVTPPPASPSEPTSPPPVATPPPPPPPPPPAAEAPWVGPDSGDNRAPLAGPSDRPEIAVGAAFAGGFLLAMILRRLAR